MIKKELGAEPREKTRQSKRSTRVQFRKAMLERFGALPCCSEAPTRWNVDAFPR